MNDYRRARLRLSVARRVYRLSGGSRSISEYRPEVQPAQRELAGVGLDQILDVERSVTGLHADVVREVHGAVHVDVDVMRLVSLVDAVGDLEARDVGGDRDVRHHVDPRNAAQRRYRPPRARELLRPRTVELDAYVRVFRFENEPDEAPVLGDEVVLVPETVGLPVHRRAHRHGEGVANAVENDRNARRGRPDEADRNVLESELVAL